MDPAERRLSQLKILLENACMKLALDFGRLNPKSADFDLTIDPTMETKRLVAQAANNISGLIGHRAGRGSQWIGHEPQRSRGRIAKISARNADPPCEEF